MTRSPIMECLPFQRDGAAWLADTPTGSLRMNAADMGTGKTLQALAAMELCGADTISIICPAMVRDVWAAEIAKFWPERERDIAMILTKQDKVPKTGIVIASYEQAVRKDIAARRKADVLCLDEAHYLKERRARRTKMMYSRRTHHESGRVFALTGTPVLNGPWEVYPHLSRAGAWRWGYSAFLDHFCQFVETPFGSKFVGMKHVGELRRLLQSVMYRVTFDSPSVGIRLPPLREHQMYIDGSGETMDEIRAIECEIGEQIKLRAEASSHGGGIVSKISKEADHIATLRRLIGRAKAPAVAAEARRMLQSGETDGILIFAIHKDTVQTLRAELAEFQPFVIDGSASLNARRASVAGFMAPGAGRPILIANITSAGTGITLTQCKTCIFAESDWTPANNLQAMRRIHRIGQSRGVDIHWAELIGSVDEMVTETLRKKRQIVDEILTMTE